MTGNCNERFRTLLTMGTVIILVCIALVIIILWIGDMND